MIISAFSDCFVRAHADLMIHQARVVVLVLPCLSSNREFDMEPEISGFVFLGNPRGVGKRQSTLWASSFPSKCLKPLAELPSPISRHTEPRLLPKAGRGYDNALHLVPRQVWYPTSPGRIGLCHPAVGGLPILSWIAGLFLTSERVAWSSQSNPTV